MVEVGIDALRDMLDPSLCELPAKICDLEDALKELRIIYVESLRPQRAEVVDAVSLPMGELHHVCDGLLGLQS